MQMFNPATNQTAEVTPEQYQQVWANLGWNPVDPAPEVDEDAEPHLTVVGSDQERSSAKTAEDKSRADHPSAKTKDK